MALNGQYQNVIVKTLHHIKYLSTISNQQYLKIVDIRMNALLQANSLIHVTLH